MEATELWKYSWNGNWWNIFQFSAGGEDKLNSSSIILKLKYLKEKDAGELLWTISDKNIKLELVVDPK